MTPQGIQSHSEEKEIVCLVWSLDAVEGRSPDTILLVQPNGMVETVGSIPSCISHTQNNYGILRRSFNVDCTDCNVHVWLSYIDCGCIESATSLRCDSNPVPQTNLGLTSLYSLLLFGWITPVDWLPIGVIFAHGLLFNEATYRGVYMGSMLVAHHFLSRDFVLAFSNSKPMYSFLNFLPGPKTLREGGSFGL